MRSRSPRPRRRATGARRLARVAIGALSCALLCLSACVDDSGTRDSPITPDALVVVQETNLSICSEPYVYELPFTRSCDGKELHASVCSAEPLCGAQIDDLIEPLVECRAESDSYEASTDIECPAE